MAYRSVCSLRLAAVFLALAALAWATPEGLRAQNAPGGGGPGVPQLPPGATDAPRSTAAQVITSTVPVQAETQLVLTNFGGRAAPRRFQFKIAPETPLKELLPTPPAAKKGSGLLLSDDLAKVPEVQFQSPAARGISSEEALKQTAHQIAKVNHLNGKAEDGFLEALRGGRADLIGLPFAMGDACRTKGERSKRFNEAVATVRGALQQRTFIANQINAFRPQPVPSQPGGSGSTPPQVAPPAPVPERTPPPADVLVTQVVQSVAPPERTALEGFWERYQAACAQEDKALNKADRDVQEHVTLARVAALMQVLAPESASMRLGLVKYLSAVAHAEATKALAKLAVFSNEEEVRRSAVDALKVRRERDYTAILMSGLRYPLPVVAKRTADALVKLERSDLVEQLVGLLDEPDPRAPVVKEVGGKKMTVAREVVRINHHRNCLLCHAPGNTSTVAPTTLTAAVPIQTDPLPTPSDGYQPGPSPDVLIRVDVTYLRQDFSAFLPVSDANPWPEMQRFDFLVRTRELSADEADAYRDKLTAEPGRPSPYQRAALSALRELTGRDAEPTAEAWRKLLGLPTPKLRVASAR